MRPYRLFHQIVLRFSAMDESEAVSLHGEAEQAYNQQLAEAKSKLIENQKRLVLIEANRGDPKFLAPKEQVLTIGDKMVLGSEKWYMRYGFSIIYIIVVPMIRDYMNGEGGEGSDEDGEEEMFDAMKFYSKFKKFKKS